MKTVVAGLGRMGIRHLTIAKQMGLDIVGVADQRAETRQSVQSEFGLPDSCMFSDAELMLKTARAQCAIIATTADSHEPLTCLAAANGASYILCEKPMATSLAGCKAMTDVCKANGTRLAINHQMRFMEQYLKPKTVIDSEAFGGLGSATVTAGNFGLAMNGTHYFEMFRFLTGEEVVRVNARFSGEVVPNPRGAQFVDRAGTVRLETASGKRFYLDASADQGHGMFVVYQGRYGRISIDELTGEMRVVTREPEYRALPTTRYGMPVATQDSRIAPTDAFEPTRAVLHALLDDADIPDGFAGQRAVETLVACYLSDEQDGNTVHIGKDRLPDDRVFPWA